MLKLVLATLFPCKNTTDWNLHNWKKALQTSQQGGVLPKILPRELYAFTRKGEDEEYDLSKDKVRAFRYFDGKTSEKNCGYIRQNILRTAQVDGVTVYHFYELKLRRQIEDTWQQLLDKNDADGKARAHFEAVAAQLVNTLDLLLACLKDKNKTPQNDTGELDAKGLLDALRKSDAALMGGEPKKSAIYQAAQRLRDFFAAPDKPLTTKLACMIFLAAAVPDCWDKFKEKRRVLHELAPIIMPIGKLTAEDLPPMAEDHDETDSKTAEQLSRRARDLYKRMREQRDREGRADPQDLASCCSACRSVLALEDQARDIARGTAYYYLFKCHQEFGAKEDPKLEYDARLYAQRALAFGSRKAREDNAVWSAVYKYPLLYEPQPGEGGSVPLPQRLLANADNARLALFLSTLPPALSVMERDKLLCVGPVSQLIATLDDAGSRQWFLLFDDDEEKNFSDALHILDAIKKSHVLSENIQTEIYVRLSEERYETLLDTALSRMEGKIVPLYVIDENKFAAQRLLSLHPLFYPLHTIRAGRLENKKARVDLHFVIICTAKYELACWLVRESAYLACFMQRNIMVHITVLSPQSSLLEAQLRALCPGLFNEDLLGDADASSLKLSFLPIVAGSHMPPEMLFLDQAADGSHMPPRAFLLDQAFDKIFWKADRFMYFAVLGDSDVEGLDLAIHVREWCIRRAVRADTEIERSRMSVIAFACKDPTIAQLAKNTVVQAQRHGGSWYNDYALLPFGMLTERYTWDTLDGGRLERMAQCTHLQYCGCRPDAPKKICRQELRDSYFNRLYNRDSSLALALSLPYRLFQVKKRGEMDRHICPENWSIDDETAYTGASLEKMLSAFADIGQGQKKTLAQYEHTRWNRYMLSRGWLPATADETISYILAGNPKQQLYIGRMHSCIIPWDGLEELQKRLQLYASTYEEGKKNPFERFTADCFTDLDKKNIADTAAIFLLAWFNERESENAQNRDRVD